MATDKAPNVLYLSPAKMEPWPGLNPRRRFDEEKLAELTESVREHGVLQPIVVHDRDAGGEREGIDQASGAGPRYWIVAGETRWRSATRAELERIPAVVRVFTEAEALRIALLENLHRNALTPIEEARGFRRLLDLDEGISQEAIAADIKRSQAYVSNRLRLLELPSEVLDLVEHGHLHASHARDLLLPFGRLPKQARAKLFAGVAGQLAAIASESGEAVTKDDVEDAVREVGTKLSRSIDSQGGYYYEPGKTPLFEAKEHEACPCKAPPFKWTVYGGGPTVRCFDEAWWNRAQKDAQKRIDREKAEAQKKLEAQAEAVQGQAVVDAKDIEAVYPSYRERTTIAHSTESGATFSHGVLIDVARLPEDSLIVVKREYSGAIAYELVCTKPGSVNAAKGAMTRERAALVELRRAERRERDLASAAEFKVEPWMLELLVREASDHQYGTTKMAKTALELGIATEEHSRAAYPEHLDEDQIETVIKVFALRHRRGDFKGWRDPVEEAVDEELRAKYEPALASLLPRSEKKAPGQKARKELERAWSAFGDVYDALPHVTGTGSASDASLTQLVALARAKCRVDQVLNEAPGLHLPPNEAFYYDVADGLLVEADIYVHDEDDAVCIRCKCTDSEACPEGCAWLVVDRDRGLGVCSSCAEDVEQAAAALAEAAA